LLLGGLAPAASAHALLQSSDPAAGATLGSSPTSVTLTFGERPDPGLSSIKVLDTAGANHAAGAAESIDGKPLELRVAVAPLPDGVYTVSWRTLSAVDGHSAAGAFSFGVGVAAPSSEGTGTAPSSGLAGASIFAALARLVLYVGLIAMFGAGLVGAAIAPSRAGTVVRLGLAGWLLSALGTAGVIAIQWSGAGADVGAILATSLGRSGLERLAAEGVGLLAVISVQWSTGRPRRAGLAIVTVVAAAGMAVDVASGHSGAVEPAIVQMALGWLHVAAAGVWIGGLAALLIALRDASNEERAPAAKCFSTLAGLAIGTVALTGLLRAIAEVGTWDGLFGTDYGRLVIVKSLLLGILAVLGATNRFWSVPAAGRTITRLRRIGTTELAVAVAVLTATSFLVDLAPPVSVGAAAPPALRPIVVVNNDFGTSVRLRLVVTPGTPGTSDFAAAVTDYDTKAPLDASDVSLRFELVSGDGVGPSTLDLARKGPGEFDASGGNLSLDGTWQVTATVTAGSHAVEVPLVVSTTVGGQPVDANVTAGLPTIYTVHLAGSATLQVYLDPDRAGSGELHATFFDAAGTELPVANATIAITSASGLAELLRPRQLEPGHFVADVTLDAGPLVVDVVGPNPVTGAPIHVHLTFPVQP
ncbi:MAG TPA: copper resistance protein CopC, partial [Candidatus Limnocylindrales bacterium]|nr:copper resistance protein CopC [Candidatus Limnocylindrales bacterium]